MSSAPNDLAGGAGQVSPTAAVLVPREAALKRFLRITEIDTRMIGTILALLVIWVGFQIYGQVMFGQGLFLTPRNLWNLLVQTSSISVMASGMVLIIVMRHIDLSVGSVLGVSAMIIGVTQVNFLPQYLGLGNPAIWIISVLVGIATGAVIGGFQGILIAYCSIPSFIVTLGGLLFWRGAAWWVARGETIAPVDAKFSLIGGGPHGSIGAQASWILALLACGAVVAGLYFGRQRRIKFRFALRPVWAEAFLAVIACIAIIGTTMVVNAYYWPMMIAKRYAEANHIVAPPDGLQISTGYAIPVLIALTVTLVMSFVATRTKFGRYIYAIGGNPEAAELAGINTRKLTVYAFALMGGLAGISACISTARLNSATNSAGQFDELYVIAATVIGGTSLAGGSGTIYGAILGALIMQSLQSGMVLMGVDSAVQQMVVAVALVGAVFVDTLYRKRSV